MNLNVVKKGIAIATILAVVSLPVQSIAAGETAILRFTKKQDTQTMDIENSQGMFMNEKISDKVFVKVEGESLQILATPEETEDYVGKVFPNSVVKILEQDGEWTKIESGTVTGYTNTDNLIIGKDAIVRAKELLEKVYPGVSVLTLTEEQKETVFSVAESKEEEAARLAAAEAARLAEDQARLEAERAAKLAKGKEVAQYAKQFIGNPYVYGGTSLTRGTDCSGFVKSVYKHFGVELPRTSYEMRRVGYKVSYSEAQPGDIICYRGHVGIYVGNGKIVNAIDESTGIALSNARKKPIVTVRRIF